MKSDRKGLGANQKKVAQTISGLTPLKALNSDVIHYGKGHSRRASSATWRALWGRREASPECLLQGKARACSAKGSSALNQLCVTFMELVSLSESQLTHLFICLMETIIFTSSSLQRLSEGVDAGKVLRKLTNSVVSGFVSCCCSNKQP